MRGNITPTGPSVRRKHAAGSDFRRLPACGCILTGSKVKRRSRERDYITEWERDVLERIILCPRRHTFKQSFQHASFILWEVILKTRSLENLRQTHQTEMSNSASDAWKQHKSRFATWLRMQLGGRREEKNNRIAMRWGILSPKPLPGRDVRRTSRLTSRIEDKKDKAECGWTCSLLWVWATPPRRWDEARLATFALGETRHSLPLNLCSKQYAQRTSASAIQRLKNKKPKGKCLWNGNNNKNTKQRMFFYSFSSNLSLF